MDNFILMMISLVWIFSMLVIMGIIMDIKDRLLDLEEKQEPKKYNNIEEE